MEFSSEDLPTGTINSNFTADLLDRLLPALPQQTIANIESLTLDQRDSEQVPYCLTELFPKMKNLKSLTLETKYDCTTLKSTLSKVPTLKTLTLDITLSPLVLFYRRKLIYDVIEGICTCKCNSPDVISLLQYLPQQYLAQIQSFEVNYHRSLSLPPFLPVLLSRMKTLDTLTIKNTLGTSLLKLLPVLYEVTTLRNLTLHKLNSECIAVLCKWLPVCQLKELILQEQSALLPREIKITISNTSIEAIKCQYCESGFIDRVLPQIPQQSIAQVKILTIWNEYMDESNDCMDEYEDEYEDHHHHNCCQLPPIPPGLLKLMPRMESLNELVLKNVSETSLLSALSRAPNLRNLEMENRFMMQIPAEDLSTGVVVSTNNTQEFLDQLLPALPHQAIVHIKSLTIQCDRYPDVQPLPSCLLELVPKMECLNSLTLKTVLDSTLKSLMSLLSEIPVQRNLMLRITTWDPLDYNDWSDIDSFTYGTVDSICTCTCNNSCHLLKYLPQVHVAQIHSFELTATYRTSIQELQELIFRMTRLNELTLKNVRDCLLTKLIPVLSRVSTLRDLTLSKLSLEGIALLCNWLSTCQLETLTLIEDQENHVTFHIHNHTIDTIECQYCSKDFVNQILSEIPQQSMAHVKELTIVYRDFQIQSLPPCLPKLISLMEALNTLILNNVLDTSLTELRVPMLSRVTTLKNVAIESDLENFEMLSPIDCAPAVTINSISKSNQFLFQLLQQNITHIESVTVTNSQEAPQPLPLFLPKLTPTMERLKTLILYNVTDSSLTELIPVLSKVPFIANLTLHELNSESIVCLCQWLSKCKLETLTVPFLSSEHIEMVTRALSTTVSSLNIYRSDFTPQSMETFLCMLQQEQSPNEIDISGCRISTDSIHCLIKALHYNRTLRKLDMSDIQLGEREVVAIAEMLKYNTALEELNLSETSINSDGAVALAEALCHNNTTLRMLVMSENPIEERGAMAMAEMLEHNRTLELNLSGSFDESEIGTKGMLALIKSVAHGPNPRLTVSNEEYMILYATLCDVFNVI